MKLIPTGTVGVAGRLATALIVAGCSAQSPVAQMNGAADVAASKPKASKANPVAVFSAQAKTALDQGNPAAAISFAELAVAADPIALAPRQLLAQAYFNAGRFQSAAQAYDDLVRAGDTGNAAFRAALADLASGNRDAALARLRQLETTGDKADIGLAYALAGETAQAVEILTAAVRGGANDARTRQNLALAQALDGQWAAARATALQDIQPGEFEQRVGHWSRIREQAGAAQRTTTLLAIAPTATDAGRPVQLAWAAPQPEPVAVAAATHPQPLPVEAAQTAPVAVPAAVADVSPAADAPAPVPDAVVQSAPEPVAETAAAVQPAPVVEPVAVAAFTPVSTPVVRVQPASEQGWVVQLAAYAQRSYLERGWMRLQARSRALDGREAIATEFTTADGKLVHRLAVGGFDTRKQAVTLCSSLQREGRACFVRAAAPDAVQLASR